MVALLTSMPKLRMRKHFFYYFRLSCLWLDASNSPELPVVNFPEVDSGGPRCGFLEVFMPAQSFLANVPGSVAIWTTEASLDTYRDIEAKLSSACVPGDPSLGLMSTFLGRQGSTGSYFLFRRLWKTRRNLSLVLPVRLPPVLILSIPRVPQERKLFFPGKLRQPMPSILQKTLVPAFLKVKCTLSTFVFSRCMIVNCINIICVFYIHGVCYITGQLVHLFLLFMFRFVYRQNGPTKTHANSINKMDCLFVFWLVSVFVKKVAGGVRSKNIFPSSVAWNFFLTFISRYSGHGKICAPFLNNFDIIWFISDVIFSLSCARRVIKRRRYVSRLLAGLGLISISVMSLSFLSLLPSSSCALVRLFSVT